MLHFRILLAVILLSPVARSQSPDYAQLLHWAAHPQKRDLADSVPRPFRKDLRDTAADVFFIHPTTYTGARTGWNADLNDSALNRRTDETTILFQATAFNARARIFAPRYRQGHYRAFFISKDSAQLIFDTAYADVKAAFAEYLAQHHRGRPIVIAAHSQGAMLAQWLLRDFFDGKPLQRYLVAAYIPGWPLDMRQYRNLKACATAVQTGCLCAWRTYREGYLPEWVPREPVVSAVTNPLSWRTDTLKIHRLRNKNAILQNFNKTVDGVATARIHRGVLWIDKPRFRGSFLYTTKNYHIADINFFYGSVRRNVADRIDAFLRVNVP